MIVYAILPKIVSEKVFIDENELAAEKSLKFSKALITKTSHKTIIG